MKAEIVLVVVTLVAALGWIFSKEVLSAVAPLLFIGLRFGLAGLILAATGWKQLVNIGREDLIRSIRVGVLFTLAMICWILGLQLTEHIGVGAFITSLGVVLVPVVLFMFGERPPAKVWLALPLAVAGLAALSLDSHVGFGWAELAFLASALLFAFFFVMNSRAAVRVPLTALTSVQLLSVGIGGLIFSVVMGESWRFDFAAEIWSWFIASVVIATCLRFFMQTWAQGRADISRAALIMTLEPVWAALVASYWFSEKMSSMQLLGCVLIFTALVLSRISGLRKLSRLIGLKR